MKELYDKNGNKIEFITKDELVYSYEEVYTGKTWIDGKKIYRKIIYISSLPNNTDTYYPHNINNIDTIWIKNAFWQEKSGSTGPIPMYFNSSQITSCFVNISDIYINVNENYSNRKGYVVIEYTKTTD